MSIGLGDGLCRNYETRLETIEADIVTNAADIVTNAADIVTNAAGVATNVADIATNTTGVAINVANIATNAAGVATNVADIAGHETRLDTIEGWKFWKCVYHQDVNAATFDMSFNLNYAYKFLFKLKTTQSRVVSMRFNNDSSAFYSYQWQNLNGGAQTQGENARVTQVDLLSLLTDKNYGLFEILLMKGNNATDVIYSIKSGMDEELDAPDVRLQKIIHGIFDRGSTVNSLRVFLSGGGNIVGKALTFQLQNITW